MTVRILLILMPWLFLGGSYATGLSDLLGGFEWAGFIALYFLKVQLLDRLAHRRVEESQHSGVAGFLRIVGLAVVGTAAIVAAAFGFEALYVGLGEGGRFVIQVVVTASFVAYIGYEIRSEYLRGPK